MVRPVYILPCGVPSTMVVALVDRVHYISDCVFGDYNAVIFSFRLSDCQQSLSFLVPSKGLQDVISTAKLFLRRRSFVGVCQPLDNNVFVVLTDAAICWILAQTLVEGSSSACGKCEQAVRRVIHYRRNLLSYLLDHLLESGF